MWNGNCEVKLRPGDIDVVVGHGMSNEIREDGEG